jgi:AAA+ superfamily predicted ATPase
VSRFRYPSGRAVAAAGVAYGPEAAGDSYRGLYVGAAEVGRLLARRPLVPPLGAHGTSDGSPALGRGPRFRRLQEAFDLSAFDVDALAVALAPELDLRYERLFAYLQDDVSRRRPGVDLVLNLLCQDAVSKLARRARFAADAPLVRHGLVHLVSEPGHLEPPLLSRALTLDEQIVALLAGAPGLDSRLAPFCRRVPPAPGCREAYLAAETQLALSTLVREARAERRPLRLHFQGLPGSGRRATAEALAAEAGAVLLVTDLARAVEARVDLALVLPLVFRQAWLEDAVLFLENVDALRDEDRGLPFQRLLEHLAGSPGVSVLGGVRPWAPPTGGALGVVAVSFPLPTVEQGRRLWAARLESEGAALTDADLDALATRFRLMPSQIDDAAATAANLARLRAAARGEEPADAPAVTLADAFAAARPHGGHDLAWLALKVEAVYAWDDIVLPPDALEQLREVCRRMVHRHRVLEEWGFGRKLPYGRGVNALFSGPSGTGKTMAAEIIASELALDLYRIDLSQVVSKYIGETERNLEQVFTAAERTNAVLFFDEADALFGKRSEVRDAHDRYANIEIAYLLQRVEHYEGLAILATNLRQNLDDAFLRRLQFIVEFPFPDEADRLRIWRGAWPPGAPLGHDVDLPLLARRLRLTGGSIRNITLAAAFLAAAEGRPVGMAHVLRATRREMEKMGQKAREDDLVGPA